MPHKRRRVQRDPSKTMPAQNAQLADLFLTMSKLYKSSPLMPEDIWKAYMFHKIAGRLLCLPFPLGEEQLPLKKLVDQVPGLGDSTMTMIAEFIERGTISRIKRLKYDPTRIAMKNMMNIWGVGRVTVSLYSEFDWMLLYDLKFLITQLFVLGVGIGSTRLHEHWTGSKGDKGRQATHY